MVFFEYKALVTGYEKRYERLIVDYGNTTPAMTLGGRKTIWILMFVPKHRTPKVGCKLVSVSGVLSRMKRVNRRFDSCGILRLPTTYYTHSMSTDNGFHPVDVSTNSPPKTANLFNVPTNSLDPDS